MMADDESVPDTAAKWRRRMEELCADSDPADEERMVSAIEQHRREAKELMRQQADDFPDPEKEPDEFWKRLNELCAQGDPADNERPRAAIAEIRRQGKEDMRREMGLDG
jgi:hypothetical protein